MTAKREAYARSAFRAVNYPTVFVEIGQKIGSVQAANDFLSANLA